MSRPLAVLRPEPGNAATAARIESLGLTAISLPLFEVRSLAWQAPALDAIDALLVTSANAIRHGGRGLAALQHLPVVAVGAETARVASDAGFTVIAEGRRDAAEAVALAGGRRLLHLAGRDRAGAHGLPTVTVYASEPRDVDPAPLLDAVALVHSPRAGGRLAEVAPDRARIAVAAISANALAAAGEGWRASAVARVPTDAALIEAAAALGR
jgi:uroporphyrinogen-III synthase